MFLTAIGIFELGSLVCGAAPNSTALILGRAIAGLGSSGIFSGALLILAHSAPLEKRRGFIGGMYGIASIAGPLLGGAFTDRLVRCPFPVHRQPGLTCNIARPGDGASISTCRSAH